MTRPMLVLCVVLGAGASAHGACLDTSAFDDAQRAVDAAVRCDTVASNREYVSAGAHALVDVPLSASCRRRFVKERLKRSVCGRPGSVVCCATSSRGRTANRVVRQGQCTNGATCESMRSVGQGCTDDGRCNDGLCPRGAPGTPRQVAFTVRSAGSDLDLGWTGTFHNLPLVAGARLTYCLAQCDGAADTSCVGQGATGDGTLNGRVFGAPLPLLAAGVPVCVANRFQGPELRSTFDVATGEAQGDLDLFADVYLTNQAADVCPRCVVPGGGEIGSTGRCSAGAADPGAECRVEGIVDVALGAGDRHYTLSSRCLPPDTQRVGTLGIRAPLTTGTSAEPGPLPCGDTQGPQQQDDACGGGSCTARCTGQACVAVDPMGRCVDVKGGISQVCCSTNPAIPCFPTGDGGTLVRSGAPFDASPLGAFVATFCVPRTGSSLINGVTGLPGPGALIVPVDAAVERAP
jgi:hypothetical protein